jgi:hypothetical protein
MARENPIWGAPRIHGELLKLGLEVSERTVSLSLAKILSARRMRVLSDKRRGRSGNRDNRGVEKSSTSYDAGRDQEV